MDPSICKQITHYDLLNRIAHSTSASIPLNTRPVYAIRKYKPMDRKVKPVSTTTPEDVKIGRRFPSDPLEFLPELPIFPPDFKPGLRLTQERYDALDLNKHGFLWPEELKLVSWIIQQHEMVFAWDESEMGLFRSDYFDPVIIPTIEHTPWQHKNIPIPPGLLPKVLKVLKDKLNAGVYEPSQSSYRSRWFCVLKKDGTLRPVLDLQPLNGITIR
ncbi:hypothetical protein CALVIDRAFT_487994, partial [Calocera viscosa TUFC12733]